MSENLPRVPLPENLRYSLFAIDEFLRELCNPETRSRLIAEHGTSPTAIAEFESRRKLPAGSFELVLLLDDPKFIALTEKIQEKLSALKDVTLADAAHPVPAAQEEFKLVNDYVESQYPRATSFLRNYVPNPGGDVRLCQVVWLFAGVIEAVVLVTTAVMVTQINQAANVNAATNANAVANANATYSYNVNAGG